MSELAVGSLAGLAANSYVIDVASGSQLTQPGMVLQVLSTTKTDTFSTSLAPGSFADVTGLSVSITPSSTNSKILILASVVSGSDTNNQGSSSFKLLRDSTEIGIGDAASGRSRTSSSNLFVDDGDPQVTSQSINHLDSPATTSATTYKLQIGNVTGSGSTKTMYVNRSAGDPANDEVPRSASTITVMEVAG